MIHPHPSIWERLRHHVDADPTPGEWRLTEGEHRLIGAVQHAQAEPERRTEYAWACEPPCDGSQPCLHWPTNGDREQWVRTRAAGFGVVYVREVTEWRPL